MFALPLHRRVVVSLARGFPPAAAAVAPAAGAAARLPAAARRGATASAIFAAAAAAAPARCMSAIATTTISLNRFPPSALSLSPCPFASVPAPPRRFPLASSGMTAGKPSSVFGPAGQVRHVSYPGLRPRRMKHQKAQRGFFKLRKGGSLRGTTLIHGNYGIRVTEGGVLQDKQIDAARTLIRRALKPEKGAKFFIRTFTERPVSRKAAEVRMGKGKGAVDHFAHWVSVGNVVFEVRSARRDLAVEALRIAGEALPLKTEFIEGGPATAAAAAAGDGVARAPRCLPFFLKKRFATREFDEVVARRRAAILGGGGGAGVGATG